MAATLDHPSGSVLGSAALLAVFLAGCSLLLWHQFYYRKRAWPLANLPLPPGPRNLPLVGAIFSLPRGLLPHATFTRLAEQYGPIVHLRLGTTPFLVISSARLAKQVLKEQDAGFASRPYITYGAEYDFAGIVVTPYGPDWRHRRRVANLHLLCPEMFHSFQGVRAEEVAECLRDVHKACSAGEEVSMDDLTTTLMTNIICQSSLSKRYLVGSWTADQARSRQMQLFRHWLSESTKIFTKLCVGDIFPALRRWDIGGMKKAYRAVHAVQEQWMDAVLADRESEQRARPDFLDTLLGLKEKGEISDATVRTILYEVQGAGSGTAATSVHWAFAEVMRNPEVMRKAQEELESVVGRARRVQESDIPNLPFLRAVVKETWRLHPPVPLCIPHHNTQEAQVGGFRVPAGSTVLINTYAIGRDPESWPDRPTEFLPERFLHPSHSHIEGFGQEFELLPFSAGRRKCPGMQLGHTMVHLALASLLHSFDWALPPGVRPADVSMAEEDGVVLTRAAPCVVVPTACRLHPSVYAL